MIMQITSEDYQEFVTRWRWFLLRGYVMVFIGTMLAIITLLRPHVYMLGDDYSWIPLIGLIIFAIGIFTCIDAFITRHSNAFFMNIQVGVLDAVVGGLLFLSVTRLTVGHSGLALMVVAYLITKGILRTITAYVMQIPNLLSRITENLVSVILGVVIWLQLPSETLWLLSFALSANIALRGWSVARLGRWLQRLNTGSQHNAKMART